LCPANIFDKHVEIAYKIYNRMEANLNGLLHFSVLTWDK
jgi:hypothetical protein